MATSTVRGVRGGAWACSLFCLAAAAAAWPGCGVNADSLFATGGAGPGSTSSASGTGAGHASSSTGSDAGGASGTGGAGQGGTASTSSSSSSSASSSSGSGAGTPFCGDGVRNDGEACDGADLGGATCQDFDFENPDGLACTPNCAVDPSGCAAVCGNDVKEPGEACDGMELAGRSCNDYGFDDPAGLACAPDCGGFDPSGCAPTCDGHLEPGEVCDGNHLNGHSCQDLGYQNPIGLKCTNCALDGSSCHAVCGNGVIEPGEACDDGNTMSGDGCSSQCQTETIGGACANATMITIQPGSTMLQGSTLGGGAHAANGCASDAPDQVYALTMGASGFLTASLARMGTSFDSVLWISKACSDQASVDALLCNDSQDPNGVEVLDGGEVVSLKVAAGETYYLVVDGKTAADAGDYQLVVDLASGRSCQDPVPIPLAHGTPQRILGSNANQPMNTQGSCGGVPGGDVVYKISTDAPGTLTVATSSLDYNAVLYARSSCGNGGSELDCSNSGGPGVDEQISVDLGNTTTGVTVYVDGSQIGGGPATGSYALVLTPP